MSAAARGYRMNDQIVSNPLLFRTAMEVLRDAEAPLNVQNVLRHVSERITLTPHWLERYKSGQARWDVAIRFFTGDAATLGWITKRGGWAITEAGIEVLDSYPTPYELYAELYRTQFEGQGETSPSPALTASDRRPG